MNYECDREEFNAPWLAGRVKGHNNDNLQIEDGTRGDAFNSADGNEKKSVLTAMQLMQSVVLNKYRKKEQGRDGNEAKVRAYGVTKVLGEMAGYDYAKPRDWDKMSGADQRRLKNSF